MASRKPKTKEIEAVDEVEITEETANQVVSTEPEIEEIEIQEPSEDVPVVESILTDSYLRIFNEYLWLRGWKGKVEEKTVDFIVTIFLDKTEIVVFEGELPKAETPEELMKLVTAAIS